MATYKLIQDIEAEDHILGPLTLRQFIFALVGAFLWYLCFIVFVKHVYFLLALFLPLALFFTFFAIPFGRDQPTEVWALAKLRFWFKPRRRIWDQSGMKELVTITVPKKVERVLTKGFSQSEVESRLKALANTLDSRGWVIKNVTSDTYATGGSAGQGTSDRLIDIGSAPQEVPSYDVVASDDILDEVSNPVAQQFQTMITKSSKDYRQHLMDEMNEVRTSQQQGGPGKGWFMNQPAVPAPAATSHMRTLQPLGNDNGQGTISNQQPQASGPPSGGTASDPAILSLANNNDLNVSTLAREAHTHKTKSSNALPNEPPEKPRDEPPQDEVVVSLH